MDKINNNMVILMDSIEEIGKKLANIEGKVDSNTKRLDEAITSLKVYVNDRLAAMDNKLLAMEEKIKTLETNYTKERVLVDSYSKKNNLIIHGLPEADQFEDRNKSLLQVKNFLKAQLKIEQDISIVDAHRQIE